MENLYDKVLSMKKYKLMPEQVVVENNISIEGPEEVVKVLSINSNIDLDKPLEALGGEILISGKMITNVVYATADGELNNQVSMSPFGYKMSNQNISSGAKLNINATVVNTEVNKLMNNQLKVLTTVNVEGVVVKNNEVEYLKDSENNTFVKQKEQEIVYLAGDYCERFEEKLEATVKNGVKKVLMTNVECLVKEWNVGLNFVSVECEIYAKVLYADNQEISELQTITISKNIRQEIEANGISKDACLDLFAVVVNEGLLTEIVENNGETTIGVNIPIMVCFNAYECNKILSVVDIYSTKNILSIQNDSVENDRVCKPEYLESKIEGNVVLTDDQPRIDKYLATTNVSIITSNGYIQNGVLTLEGIVTANVIYLNDELGGIQSVEIEMPYVIDKKVDIEDQTLIEPIMCLSDVDVMVKRGREIYFDAKAKALINVSCMTNFGLISRVDNVGEEQDKDSAIEIYFARAGESFWDIAKNLRIPSEIIRNQNPELADPLEKDQNIALYYQKERK